MDDYENILSGAGSAPTAGGMRGARFRLAARVTTGLERVAEFRFPGPPAAPAGALGTA